MSERHNQVSNLDALREIGSVDAALEFLRPKPCPFPLVRLGGNRDGAYLLPHDLEGVAACMSPGVNNRKDFEDEIAERFGIASHMCDRSSDVNKLATPLKPGLQTFDKLWLDTTGAEDTVSIAQWIDQYRPNPEEDLILQMDIEGAEYRNIIATPDVVLRRFRIIVIELHALSTLNSPSRFDEILRPFLEKLASSFVSVHVHPNNAGAWFFTQEKRILVPQILEVTFLREDRLAGPDDSVFPVYIPHPLDIPFNVRNREPLFLDDYWRGRPPNSDELSKMVKEILEYTAVKLDSVGGKATSPLVADVKALQDRWLNARSAPA